MRLVPPPFRGTMMRKLGMMAMVVMALMLAACSSSQTVRPITQTGITPTSYPVTTTSAGAITTTTGANVVTTATACNASQLTVGGFGITGVSFTGVISIRIENASSLPCSLRGYPVVTFLGNASSRFDPASYPAHLLRVSEGHTRFFGAMTRVVLPPGKAASAGFVITSDGDEGSAICPTATSIRVRLPNMAASFRVDTAIEVPGIMMCAPGNAVSISPIVKGAVLAVSPQVTVPTTTTTAPARTAQ